MNAADWPPPVRLDIGEGIATLTLDRPASMNAVTTALAVALEQAVLVADRDDDVNVIVIRGAGGNFCAGGDFEEVQRLRAEGPGSLRSLFECFHAACAAVEAARVPVVAVVEGVAMAGGFELMQACDLVLVSDRARISDNHVNHGMVPGGGGSQRLPRALGRQQSLGLLLTGDRLSGQEAVAAGLAYRSFPAETFDDDVAAVVARLASRRPEATSTIKRLVRDGLALPLTEALAMETDAVVRHICGEAGGVGAFAAPRKERS
ncbi:enoyl-CoA hydratase/isomerase family protein [Nocardioides sp.]|uniref:enoyl-CoA hydratase/isomerase family protein n=1 Tax=Nocardioides sp. TaxID=35761 RepID=UPI003511681F